jgi:DNA-binding PadR family transcriptional regulator
MHRDYWGRGWDKEWRRWSGLGGAWDRKDRLRERFFGKGDLKYLILDALRDQPRHGYDVIRELESRSGGLYTPSAGAVYPTLQMLEDMGAVTSTEQDGRKTYTITEEGRRILAERSDVIDDIAGRVKDWVNGDGRVELRETMREMGELMALLGRDGAKAVGDPEKLRQVREVIRATRDELRGILRGEVTKL